MLPEQVLAAQDALGMHVGTAPVTATVAAEETTEVGSKQFKVYVVVTLGDTDTLPEPAGEGRVPISGSMFAGAAGLQV